VYLWKGGAIWYSGRHSAGSLVALRAYLDAPEKVAAIILIAPAVTAPLIIDEVKKVTTAPESGRDLYNRLKEPVPTNPW